MTRADMIHSALEVGDKVFVVEGDKVVAHTILRFYDSVGAFQTDRRNLKYADGGKKWFCFRTTAVAVANGEL